MTREKLVKFRTRRGDSGEPCLSQLFPLVSSSAFGSSLFSLSILPLGLNYLLPRAVPQSVSCFCLLRAVSVGAACLISLPCYCVLHPGAPFPTSVPSPPLPSPTPPTSFSALKGKNIHVSLTSSGPPMGQTSLCICLPWSPLRLLSLGTLLVASWPEKHLHVSLWLCFFL